MMRSRIVVRRRLCGDVLLCLFIEENEITESPEPMPESVILSSTATEFEVLRNSKQFPRYCLDKTHMAAERNWLLAMHARNVDMPHKNQASLPLLFARFYEDHCEFISASVDNQSGIITAIREHGNLKYNEGYSKHILRHAIIVSNRVIPKRVTFSVTQFRSFAAATLPKVPSEDGILTELRYQKSNESAFSMLSRYLTPSRVADDLEFCVRSSALPLLFTLSRISGLSCDQICSMSTTSFSAFCMKCLFVRSGFYPCPLAGALQELHETTEPKGGKVLNLMQTTSPVLVLDFFMLYPSIVVANNLGVGTTFVVSKSERKTLNKFEGIRAWQRLPFASVVATNVVEGPFSASMRYLMHLRKNFSTVGEKTALKLIANTSVGILSTELGSFLGGRAVADIITYEGRQILSRLATAAEKRGLRVIYGDTDSVFLEHQFTEDKSIIAESLCKEVTDSTVFSLRLEHSFSRFFAKRKKQYVGFGNKDDPENVVIKGVPHSMSPVFKRSFGGLLRELSCGFDLKSTALRTCDIDLWTSYNESEEEFVILSDGSICEAGRNRNTMKRYIRRDVGHPSTDGNGLTENGEISSCFSKCVSASYIFRGVRGELALIITKEESTNSLIRLLQNQQVEALLGQKLKHYFLVTENLRSNFCLDIRHIPRKLQNILKHVMELETCTHDSKFKVSLRLEQDKGNIYFDPPVQVILETACLLVDPEIDDLRKLLCTLSVIVRDDEANNKAILDALLAPGAVALHTGSGTFTFVDRRFAEFLDVRYDVMQI